MPSSAGFKKRRAARFDCPPEAPPAPPDPAAPVAKAPAAKGPAKGPGKGAAKGPAKGNGKSPAEAPAAKGPAKGPGKGPGKGPAKGKGKSAAEAPAAKGPAKGPGKGPAKGPAKGKGKSPAEATRTPPPKAPAMRESEDDIQIREPDEVKVQEDQLLTEREEFICKICQIHVVGCRPKLTSCAHLFCGDCIARWFDQHPQTWAQKMKAAGPNREAPCPVCRNILNESDLVTVSSDTQGGQNTLLWRMLSGLRIICVNNHKLRKEDGQCDWVGTYGTYQTHIQDCKNVPLATSVPVENQPEREEVPAADNGFSAGYSDTGVVGVASGDFEPTGPTVIRVRKGDTIEVLETHHTGWSVAKNLSQSSPPGWVPSWILDSNRPAAAPAPAASSVMQPTQTPTFWAQATTDFDAGGRDREMTLSKDDLIEIVEYDSNASGWSFGRIVDHGGVALSQGYFPNWACTPFSP